MLSLKKTQPYFARLFHSLGLTTAASGFFNGSSSNYLRAINYHWTPSTSQESLASQFEYFAEKYHVLDAEKLRLFLNGSLELQKPGILITFDDGYRNQYDIAARCLDRFGLCGWFFVVSEAGYGDAGVIKGNIRKLNARYCMDWKHIEDLSLRGHEIGCHTATHSNVGHLDKGEIHSEIVSSKQTIEKNIGRTVKSFCFPYGTNDCFNTIAVKTVVEHYEFAFHSFPSPIRPNWPAHSIGRIPCEPDWDISLLAMKLSGAYDLRYKKELRHYSEVLAQASRSHSRLKPLGKHG